MKEVQLTQGPIFRQMIRFSLPMIAGNLLQQIYYLMDTLIVGRYVGADALAAVGSAYTLMTFLNSIIIGLCMGSGTFFSMDCGARQRERLREDVRLSFWLILAVTCAIYAVIYPGLPVILRLLQTPPELMDMMTPYVRISFAGIAFVFLYHFFAYLLRALGNSVVPLSFLAGASVMNIALDIWLVMGLEMGVSGAAWATVAAQAAAGVGLMAYALCKLPELRGRRSVRGLGKRLRHILCHDVATGIQQSVMNFGILMIQGLVNSFGPVIMAAFAAAVKIDTLAYMPAQEFGNAYSLFVSQNRGANKPARIQRGTRLAFGVSAGFCLAVSVVIVALAERLMGVFVDAKEVEIIAEGARYLRIEGAMYAGIGMLFLWYGYFRGIGQPRVSLILTVVSLGTRVALSYILVPALGVQVIWYAIPFGWLLADVTGYLVYRESAAMTKYA